MKAMKVEGNHKEPIHLSLKFEVNSFHPNVNKLTYCGRFQLKNSINWCVDQLQNPSQDADVKSFDV